MSDFLARLKSLPWEKQQFLLAHIARFLAHEESLEKLENVLTSFDYLNTKVLSLSPTDLINDFDFLPSDHELRVVQSAIRMSAFNLIDTLQERKGARRYPYLAGQLLARLLGNTSPLIMKLLKDIQQSQNEPWLRPLTPCLPQPGGLFDRTLRGRTLAVTVLALTPDGETLVSGHQYMYIWWQKYVPLSWSSNTSEMFGQNFAADKSYHAIKVWNIATGDEQVGWGDTHHPITAIAPMRDNEHALVATRLVIRRLNLKTGLVERIGNSVFEQGGAVFLIALPDGQNVVRIAPGGNQIDWCQLPELQTINTLTYHTKPISAIGLSENGKYLFTGDFEGRICVWRCLDQMLVADFQASRNAIGGLVPFTAEDHRLIVVNEIGKCQEWDWSKQTRLSEWELPKGIIQSTVITPDDRYLVAAASSGEPRSAKHTLLVWNLEDKVLHGVFDYRGDSINSVLVTPDNKFIITASSDRKIRFWELSKLTAQYAASNHQQENYLPNQEKIDELLGDVSIMRTTLHSITPYLAKLIGVTADGRYGVVRSNEGEIVWDLENGQHIDVNAPTSAGIIVVPKNKQDEINNTVFRMLAARGDGDESGLIMSTSTVYEGRYIARTTITSPLLEIWDTQTETTVAMFLAEDDLGAVVTGSDDNTLILVEKTGRLHFLRLESENDRENTAEYHIDRAILLQREKKLDLALIEIEKAREIAPLLARVYLRRSFILADLGKEEETLTNLNRAIELSHDESAMDTRFVLTQASRQRSVYFVKHGEFDTALNDINSAITSAPPELSWLPELYFEKAAICLELRRYSEVLTSIETCLALERGVEYPDVYVETPALVASLSEFENRKKQFRYSPVISLYSAIAYAGLGKMREALSRFGEALRRKPNWDVVYRERIKTYKALGEYDKAIEDCNQLISINPAVAGLYYERAILRYQLKNYEDSIVDITKSIELSPQETFLYTERAGIYLASQKYAEAQNDLQYSLSLDNTNAITYHNFANYYQLQGDFQSAIDFIDQALELKPDFIPSHLVRGQLFVQLGQIDKANVEFEHTLDLEPNNGQLCMEIASIFQHHGFLEVALNYIDKALQLDPSEINYQIIRGQLLFQMKKYSEAITSYTTILGLQPTNTMVLEWRAENYRYLGQIRTAIEDYDTVIRLDPHRSTAYFSRGDLYAALNRHEEALQDFTKVIELESNNHIAYYNRGNSYKSQGLYELAVQDYRQCLLINPNYSWAHVNIGELLLRFDQPDAAILEFDHAITIEPMAIAYTNRAAARLMKKQQDEALADLNAALMLDPNYAPAYVNRATIYRSKGLNEKALEDLEKNLQLNPNQSEAYWQRSLIFIRQKQFELARQEIAQYLYRKPNDQNAQHLLSILDHRQNPNNARRGIVEITDKINQGDASSQDYLERGLIYEQTLADYVAALADYQRAIELQPEASIPHMNTGNTLDAMGRYDEALEFHNKAIELEPNLALTYTNRGNTLLHLQRFTEALEDYALAIELEPNDPLPILNRGGLYFAQKRFDAALQDYLSIVDRIPKFVIVRQRIGQILLEQQKYEQAIVHLLVASELGDQGAKRALIFAQEKLFSNVLDSRQFNAMIVLENVMRIPELARFILRYPILLEQGFAETVEREILSLLPPPLQEIMQRNLRALMQLRLDPFPVGWIAIQIAETPLELVFYLDAFPFMVTPAFQQWTGLQASRLSDQYLAEYEHRISTFAAAIALKLFRDIRSLDEMIGLVGMIPISTTPEFLDHARKYINNDEIFDKRLSWLSEAKSQEDDINQIREITQFLQKLSMTSSEEDVQALLTSQTWLQHQDAVLDFIETIHEESPELGENLRRKLNLP